MNDYHAFTSTTGGGSGGGGGGCAPGFFGWILLAVGILYLIGKLL